MHEHHTNLHGKKADDPKAIKSALARTPSILLRQSAAR
jgi:hypothetical protein